MVEKQGDNEAVEVVEERLHKQFGTLMTMEQLAKETHKTVSSLAYSLSSSRCREAPWVRTLKEARVYLGRRRYFRVDMVARLLVYGG